MYHEVKKCRLCGCEKLKDVLDLGGQYVVNFIPEEDRNMPKAPLKVMKCEECQLVQLRYSVPQSMLYDKFFYRSGVNEQMREALGKIVDSVDSLVTLDSGDKVLDIGCNDGTLLGWYPGKVTTVGVEPCKALLEDGIANKRVDIAIDGYFSKDLVKQYGPYKVITAIAMFYDVEDPVDFLKDCKAVLSKAGVLVIQMNYLPSMLKGYCVDNVCHEHLTYFSMSTMLEATKRAGLEIVGAETNDVNGGSFRVYVTHPNAGWSGTNESANIVFNGLKLRREEQKQNLDKLETYFNFAQAVNERCRVLKEYLIAESEKGARIWIYGASTRGTVLMQALDLPNKVIQGAAERDENKYGLRMVGTWTKIYDEQFARTQATHFLVLPYHFLEQVWRREEEWLRGGGKLIIPLPEPRIMTGDGKEKQLMKVVKPKTQGVMVQ